MIDWSSMVDRCRSRLVDGSRFVSRSWVSSGFVFRELGFSYVLHISNITTIRSVY